MNLVTNGVPYVDIPQHANHCTFLGLEKETISKMSNSWEM